MNQSSSNQYKRIDGKKLERASDKIFQQNFIEIVYNDYSPICAMICIDPIKYIMMDQIKSLEYYGYKTTMIEKQDAGWIIYVYQDQDKEGKKI